MKILFNLSSKFDSQGRVWAFCVLAFGLTCLQPLAVAATVEDYEESPGVMVEPNLHEGTSVAIVPDPSDPKNKVFKLSWAAHSGTHVAANLTASGGVVADAPGVYKIKARVSFEQCGPEVLYLSIRLVDSRNETYQLTVPVTQAGEPGWQTVQWTLDTNNPDTGGVKPWGSEVNEQIDFPIRFYGFAASFDEYQTSGGQLLIDDITVAQE